VQRKYAKNKVLPHPVLARGLNLDTLHPSLLLAALLSQREDKQLQKSTTLSTTVQLSQPSQLSIQEITLRLKACKRECAFYQEHGKQFCRKHLENRKRIAKEQDDEEAFHKICAIIQREQQQNIWQKLNYVTGKKKSRSATSIQVKCQEGSIIECTTQETVEKTIFSEIHKKRYMLAGEAPICNG
jgi:hypothetical protein